MAENEPLRLEKEGPVCRVVLSRPERLNTLTPALFEMLPSVFQKLDEEAEVRVVVIQAEGKGFSAGLDLQEAGGWFELPSADSKERLRKRIHGLQESMNSIESCRKPVIALVHGPCIGGGVDLCCACDIRMASEDAVFSVREVKLAMVADLGTLQRLPYLIGFGRAAELALTGRDFSAHEALQMGFVSKLFKDKDGLQEEGLKSAQEIAQLPPLAVQGIKETLRFTRDYGPRASLSYVAQKNAAALPSEDLIEAVNAFFEKRPPVFQGR